MTWTVTFEVDFDAPASGTPGTWTDLTGRVWGGTRGRVDIGRGEASLQLLNRDRHLDPTNPDAPYNLIPMRHARIVADVDGTPFPLFRGFVEEWPPVWPSADEARVAVRLVDGLAWLALSDTDVDLPAQKAGDRIGALLDLADWPEALRDLDEGQARLDPLEQVGANVRRLIEDTVEADQGRLWVAGDGKVTFRDRHATFDADPDATVGPEGIPVGAVSPSFGAGPMVNVARLEMADGRVFTTIDQESKDEFGPRDWPYRDLALPAAEAHGLGDWAVFRYGSPRTWLDRLQVRTWQRPNDVLAVGPSSRVTFTHEPPGDAGSAVVDVVVESVSHRIRSDEWLTFWDCEPWFGAGPWMVWLSDEATEGEAWLSDEATEGGRWAP